MASGWKRRAVPGLTCGFKSGKVTCAHPREVHKFDEVDGSSWCDECYAERDRAFNEIAYHYFDQGAFANV
jgi:hypothetical protein